MTVAPSATLDRTRPRWAGPTAAGRYIGVTDRTIRNYIARGLLTAYHLPGSNHVRVDLNEIDALMGAERD